MKFTHREWEIIISLVVDAVRKSNKDDEVYNEEVRAILKKLKTTNIG